MSLNIVTKAFRPIDLDQVQETIKAWRAQGDTLDKVVIQEWKNRFLASQKGRSLADIQGQALLKARDPKEV